MSPRCRRRRRRKKIPTAVAMARMLSATETAIPAVWPLERPEDDAFEGAADAEGVLKEVDDIEVVDVEDVDVWVDVVALDVVDGETPMVVKTEGDSIYYIS